MFTTKRETYRKKKRVSKNVPVSQSMVEILNANSWSYFAGTIDGASVVVTCTGDMEFLYSMGFFGKGSLSRSEPNFNECKQKVAVAVASSSQVESNGNMQKFIMSKRNYLLHTHYKDMSDSNVHDLDQSISHKLSAQCSSAQKNLEKPRSEVQIHSLSKSRNLYMGKKSSAKLTAAVFPKFSSEMFPKLAAILEMADRLNTNKCIASYVCTSKSLPELSSEVLSRLKSTQSSKVYRVPGAENVSEADSVLILDSDEENSRDTEVGGEKNSSSLDLNGGTDEGKKTLNLDSVAPSELMNKVNEIGEINSEETTCSTSGLSAMEISAGSETNQSDMSVTDYNGLMNNPTNDTSLESNKKQSLPLGSNVTTGDISIAEPASISSMKLRDQFSSVEKQEELLKLLSFLSQSTQNNFVEKPTTFMYTSTHQSKYLSALLKFYSVDPVMHFDYTCDTSQLPSAFTIAEHSISYLRVFPHVELSDSSVPASGVTILSQSNIDLSCIHSFVNSNKKTCEHQSALQIDNFVPESIVSDAKEKINNHSLSSCCKCSSLKKSHYIAYLDLYNYTDGVEEGDIKEGLCDNKVNDTSCLSNSKASETHKPIESTSLQKIIQKLFTIYQSNRENKLPVMEENDILPDFHTQLTKCLFELDLCSHSEFFLLCAVLSCQHLVSSVSCEELLELFSQLTAFQFHLIQSRYSHLINDHSLNLSVNSITEKKDSNLLAGQILSSDEVKNTPAEKSKKRHFCDSDNVKVLHNKKIRQSEESTEHTAETMQSEESTGHTAETMQSEESTGHTAETMQSEESTGLTAETMQYENSEDKNVNLITSYDNTTGNVSKLTAESSVTNPNPESIVTNPNIESIVTNPNLESIVTNHVDPDTVQLEKSKKERTSETMSQKKDKNLTDRETSISSTSVSEGNIHSNNLVITEQICIDSSSDEEAHCPPRIHPNSVYDDEGADSLVISNTSDEEDHYGKRKWQPCLKKDPYPVSESLQLMLEEAFFLSFGLGCLCVTDADKKLLNLTEMWQRFQQLKDRFIPHYAVYHYFRSKGWVPKSGLKFGCDFILYRDGPPFYHGSYSVMVMTVKDRNILPHLKRDGCHFDEHLLNWPGFSAVNRVNDHVAKTLLLCYVIWPEEDLSEEDLLSPNCLKKLKIKEVTMSRWVPSQERDTQLTEAIP